MPFRRSPTSWYTPSPDASLHVPSHRASAGARLGRPRRWRQGRPAGRADPAVVLHRRRYRPRARGVSARRGQAPEPCVASALDPDLRRAGRLRLRQSGRCSRPWRGDSRNGGSRARAEGRRRHRRRGRSCRVHDPRGVARSGHDERRRIATSRSGSGLSPSRRRHSSRAPALSSSESTGSSASGSPLPRSTGTRRSGSRPIGPSSTRETSSPGQAVASSSRSPPASPWRSSSTGSARSTL